MTKYRKGPTKDRKGALHRTTEDRQYRKAITKDHKGALHTGPQRIGNTIEDRKGLQWTTVEHYTGPQRIGNTARTHKGLQKNIMG